MVILQTQLSNKYNNKFFPLNKISNALKLKINKSLKGGILGDAELP
jgi:hypothetical protein